MVLSIAAAVGAMAMSWRFIHSDSVEAMLADVARRSFDVQVQTIGTLDAAQSHMICAAVRGDEARIIFLVEDGARVDKGDVLVRLDPADFEQEVSRLEGEVEALRSAVEAKKQVLDWVKNKVEKDIRTADFNLTIAQLERKKLMEGDGPHEIATLKENVENEKEQLEKYRLYLNSLNDLDAEGYAYPSETAAAEQKIRELAARYNAARDKLDTYEKHIFPMLVKMAEAKLEKAGQEVIQTQKCGTSEIAQAMAELEVAQARFKSSRKALGQAAADLAAATIRAPFPGIAILYETFRSGENRKPRLGDHVLPNQPILYLPDISEMIVRTQIREVDLYKIAVHQPVSVRVDAFPDTVYKGGISFIGSLAAGQRHPGSGGKYFDAVVKIKGKNQRLRPGMTARLTILTDRIEDVLALPVQAVFQDKDSMYCYRYAGGWYKKTVIETGRSNEDLVEILAGLHESNRVSLVEPDPGKIISQ